MEGAVIDGPTRARMWAPVQLSSGQGRCMLARQSAVNVGTVPNAYARTIPIACYPRCTTLTSGMQCNECLLTVHQRQIVCTSAEHNSGIYIMIYIMYIS